MRHAETNSSIATLEDWYQSRCNGVWEHHFGVRIETCDNPGWLVTLKDLALPVKVIGEMQHSLRQQFGAEMTVEGQSVQVFCRRFDLCVIAAAMLIEATRQQ